MKLVARAPGRVARTPPDAARRPRQHQLLNNYRWVLGLPIVLDSDVGLAKITGVLPWWSDGAGVTNLQMAHNGLVADLATRERELRSCSLSTLSRRLP